MTLEIRFQDLTRIGMVPSIITSNIVVNATQKPFCAIRTESLSAITMSMFEIHEISFENFLPSQKPACSKFGLNWSKFKSRPSNIPSLIFFVSAF